MSCQEKNVSRNCTSDMWFLSRSHFCFVICVAILDFFSPGAHQAGGDGARALLGCCSCSTPKGFCHFYFLWLAVSPRQGSNSAPQQLSGQGPATGKEEGSCSMEVLGGRNSWRSRPSCSSPWEGPHPEPLAGPCSLQSTWSVSAMAAMNIWTAVWKPSLAGLF